MIRDETVVEPDIKTSPCTPSATGGVLVPIPTFAVVEALKL